MELNIRILDINPNNILLFKIAILLLLSNTFQFKIAMHNQFSSFLQFRNVTLLQHSIFNLRRSANTDIHNICKIKLSLAFINNNLNYNKDALDQVSQKALHHQLHAILDILKTTLEKEMNIYKQIYIRLQKMMSLKIRIFKHKTVTLNHQMINNLYVQNQ